MTAPADLHHWRWRAACLGVDINIFYPVRFQGAPLARALAFCAACEVRAECLDLALRTADPEGIYGGLMPIERLALRRRAGMTVHGPPRVQAACGTEQGYHRHRRDGDPVCDACRAAATAAMNERRRRRRARRGEGAA